MHGKTGRLSTNDQHTRPHIHLLLTGRSRSRIQRASDVNLAQLPFDSVYPSDVSKALYEECVDPRIRISYADALRLDNCILPFYGDLVMTVA